MNTKQLNSYFSPKTKKLASECEITLGLLENTTTSYRPDQVGVHCLLERERTEIYSVQPLPAAEHLCFDYHTCPTIAQRFCTHIVHMFLINNGTKETA